MNVGRHGWKRRWKPSRQVLHRAAANKAGDGIGRRLKLCCDQGYRIAAMASLISVCAASPCLRASLGPGAQRNVSCNESGVVSMAASSGRLASSASCQTFGSGELASWKCSLASRKQARRAHILGVRCTQTTDGGNRRSLDTWIGRLAMLGFVAAIGTEISTGKGVLESAGLPTPAPTPVLGLIALAGAVTAWGVFRSTARD